MNHLKPYSVAKLVKNLQEEAKYCKQASQELEDTLCVYQAAAEALETPLEDLWFLAPSSPRFTTVSKKELEKLAQLSTNVVMLTTQKVHNVVLTQGSKSRVVSNEVLTERATLTGTETALTELLKSYSL